MSSSPRSKIAVITGANAGLGFNLAQRLVQTHSNITLCLACRNKEKALKAATSLEKISPDANISIVLLDTASVASVYTAAEEIRKRYNHIDYLYLNAGMIAVKGVDWSHLWKGLFSRNVFYMFTTGEGLLLQEDGITSDGMQKVFETNVFGHYVLIKELEDRLGNVPCDSEATSQIIWTSSSASVENKFTLEDFQHSKGKDPYASSKFAIDVLSVGLNNKMNIKNIYSHSVCPGLVMTNLTYGILPVWFWSLILPLIWLLRIFVPGMTYSTSNGTEALIWLSHQKPATLDPQAKYLSVVTVHGKPYVSSSKMNIDPDKSEKLIHELDKLDQDLRTKHQK